MDRFALKIASFCAIAFLCPVIITTYTDSHIHHIQYGVRDYWMGYGVALFALVPFFFAYTFNRSDYNTCILSNINGSALQRSLLTFISLFIPIAWVLLINFRPEFPHISILVNSIFYGLIIASMVYIHNYRFNYFNNNQMNNNSKLKRTETEYKKWLYTSISLLIVFILICIAMYFAFFILKKQYTADLGEQALIFNSFVIDLFIGMGLAIFTFFEFYQKLRYIQEQLSNQKIQIELEKHSLVTKRGYVVPLGIGREGLEKKFDELFGDSYEP